MGLSQKSMPPCWSRRIVAQYICGHRARRIMRTYHAVSQGRNWTRYEQPDAANTEGTRIPATHPAAPLQLSAGKRVLGPPVARAATAVLGANIPRAKPGDVVSMHWSSVCEVLTCGDTLAAPSDDLHRARHIQPDESLFG